MLISNDTDHGTQIRLVLADRSRPVPVVCLGGWRASRRLRSITSHAIHSVIDSEDDTVFEHHAGQRNLEVGRAVGVHTGATQAVR